MNNIKASNKEFREVLKLNIKNEIVSDKGYLSEKKLIGILKSWHINLKIIKKSF